MGSDNSWIPRWKSIESRIWIPDVPRWIPPHIVISNFPTKHNSNLSIARFGSQLLSIPDASFTPHLFKYDYPILELRLPWKNQQYHINSKKWKGCKNRQTALWKCFPHGYNGHNKSWYSGKSWLHATLLNKSNSNMTAIFIDKYGSKIISVYFVNHDNRGDRRCSPRL